MYAIHRITTNEYFTGRFEDIDIGYAIISKACWDLIEIAYIAVWKNKCDAKEYLLCMPRHKWIDFSIEELEIVEV